MESAKINIDDYGSSRLLHDIEEIGKALYLRDNPPKTSIYPKYIKDDLLLNDKKSSIWKWKPLKALTHIRNHRLNCSFFLQIHSISGLPLSFNDLSLCVHWKRKNDVLKSRFVCVKEGVAEFEETLIHRCSVYVSKSGAHDDVAKYAPKLSLLYISIVGTPNLDIGKHWIDLTKLLPLSLTELEDEKNRYGKWITSFKLNGKAKGAVINVSFGFSLSVDSFMRPNNFGKVPDKGNGKMLERVGSIPGNSSRRARVSNLSFDTKARNGNVVNEGPSVNILYELLDDDANSSCSKESSSISNEVYDDEFTVVDKGVELSKSVESLCIETINVAELFDDEVCGNFETETDFDGIRSNDNNVCIEESSEELDLFLHNLSISESRELDFSCQENQFFEDDMKNGEICEGGNLVKSRSLDDLTNIVVDEFMNLFGSDSEPESPRERLLRQFEEETLDSGNLIFDLRAIEDRKDCSNIFDSTFLFREVETEPEYESGLSLISRRKAKMLENLETNELMQKWGLNERAFVNSPRTDSGAFGSPVYLSPERPHELPSLGIGLGSFLKTKDGGFLRSINPLLFKKAKNGEKLILHVSNSVVIPLEMGCNGMDILMKWATVGSEKMLFQATRLMALEEITGKTLQQEAWESKSKMEALERGQWLLHKSEVEETQTKICCEIDSEYVSIDNIIPLAIEKIQYLLIEGLRIQSRMSTEDPPSTINVASTSNNRVDELLDMSISLNELIKSDSTNLGIVNNFTLGLQMLLRDPLRDYEPVGIPMLALVQVEKSTSVELSFKVNKVHVTGFKADPQKKQHSGSRWLHSSGMTGKQKRYPLSKSTALMRSSILSKNKMKHEDTLWSLSSYVHGEVPKWKELSGLSLYARNPDIIFN